MKALFIFAFFILSSVPALANGETDYHGGTVDINAMYKAHPHLARCEVVGPYLRQCEMQNGDMCYLNERQGGISCVAHVKPKR